ncbi:hypothetical protein D5S18_08200 [Nocardia panacis]|uniref:Uncharacterized protein n=1 Tax=Nocardia panacis TaxID=2340916 RepID=A0A3A4KLG4_9NOCA|nr:hypothetical protein [Nocardia panacis]RJO77702.1 hypothetical protein D5S18_08200 [Nocardia panacis]
MVEKFTRADYDHRRYLGSAGPISALDDEVVQRWRTEYPDWGGRYWAFVPIDPDNDVFLALRPINVTARPKDSE